MANRRSSGHIATQAGAIRMAQDAYMADRDEENRRVRQEIADNNYQLELEKMKQAQGLHADNRAWDETKFKAESGFKEREYADKQGLTAAQIEAQKLANEKARKELEGGGSFHKTAAPEDAEEMLMEFGKYAEMPQKGLTRRQENAALNMMNQGVPYGKVAASLGLTMKPVDNGGGEGIIAGGIRRLMGKPAPVAAPQGIDPSARTWTEYAGIKPPAVSVQPAQAESPELVKARGMMDYAKQMAAKNPNWVDTLSDAEFEVFNNAMQTVNGGTASQPVGGVTPPSQPVNEAPRGKIVTDQELLAQTRDADGDKQITKADLDAQYARMLNVTQTLDAKPDAVAKLTPPLLKKYREAQLYVQRYEKAMQADMDKKIAGAR